MPSMQDFFQSAPSLTNSYLSDVFLHSIIKLRIPNEVQKKWNSALIDFGERAVGEFLQLENEAEANPPQHIPYSAWGERVDELKISPAWQRLHEICAEEGLIAIGYERVDQEYSRFHQFLRLYLFHPSSAFYTCPLAMTDGSARLIELYGDKSLRDGAFQKIISRDPKQFWTSGQWMTERAGGSDVGYTGTIAKPASDGTYCLYGTKWFSSATTANMAMALARVDGDVEGSRGLSVFYIELRDKKNKLQNIRINRLKDKLGTKAMPTAELELMGTPAVLVGDRGTGVATIASLFNITRMYNSVCAIGGARRALSYAKDYAQRREAFGKKIIDHVLHAETLANLELEHSAATFLTFHLIYLLGREETNKASEDEKNVLRILIPIVKIYTGKKVIEITSEALECIGGAAYIEDTGLPRLLRNAQVFPIWEGTSNILSLDVLRAMKNEEVFLAYVKDIRGRLKICSSRDVDAIFLEEYTTVEKAIQKLEVYLQLARKEGPEFLFAGAREWAFSLARLYIAALFLELATVDRNYQSYAQRWCRKNLLTLLDGNENHRKESKFLASR